MHNLYPCIIIIYGTCISYKYISNHCQTRPPVQVLPFPGSSKECTVFVLRTGGALSPKNCKIRLRWYFHMVTPGIQPSVNCMQPRNYFGGIIVKESSQKCHLCDCGKIKGQPKATTMQMYTICKTERLFTQLTKRQSGLSLHLSQHAARLRALVLRALTLCPLVLRLVFFLKFFSHSAQERRTR